MKIKNKTELKKSELKKIYYGNKNAEAAKKLKISVSTLLKRVKTAKIGLKFQ